MMKNPVLLKGTALAAEVRFLSGGATFSAPSLPPEVCLTPPNPDRNLSKGLAFRKYPPPTPIFTATYPTQPPKTQQKAVKPPSLWKTSQLHQNKGEKSQK